MRKIGKLPFRIDVGSVRGMVGLGIHYHWDMRVLDIHLGPWVISVEGPQ